MGYVTSTDCLKIFRKTEENFILLGDLNVDGRVILKMNLKEIGYDDVD
jgi:hypothetical protein